MEYKIENIRDIRDNYHDLIMNYPLNTEQVWDREFIIRDNLEEKGYGIINFVNYPLFIDHAYYGHFNSINGDKLKLTKLYRILKRLGIVCFLRAYVDVPSRCAIVFPENVDCDLLDYIDKIDDF